LLRSSEPPLVPGHDVAHAHAPRDRLAQALVSGGGGWGHGGTLAGIPCAGRLAGAGVTGGGTGEGRTVM